jgi:UDP-N-acetylglucosamine 2-epimerase (non-hydrolysing)
VPVIHLEAGLRSRDRTMPEEINRVLTDRIADLLLCHCAEAVDNLGGEGIDGPAVQLVGNTMIDSLFALLPAARATETLARLGLAPGGYVLVTLHRPALVDDAANLGAVIDVLAGVAAAGTPVAFPLHPRTAARLSPEQRARLEPVTLLDPLEYLEFIALQADARLVVTDSGGVQEESSALGVPCLTYRPTTDRPVTIELGTNRLIGMDPGALAAACDELLASPLRRAPCRIPLWDGHAGGRAADAIAAFLRPA